MHVLFTDCVLRECSACGQQRAFEAPTCADGHGSDCSELACVECGCAVFAGFFAFGASPEADTASGTTAKASPHIAAAA